MLSSALLSSVRDAATQARRASRSPRCALAHRPPTPPPLALRMALHGPHSPVCYTHTHTHTHTHRPPRDGDGGAPSQAEVRVVVLPPRVLDSNNLRFTVLIEVRPPSPACLPRLSSPHNRGCLPSPFPPHTHTHTHTRTHTCIPSSPPDGQPALRHVLLRCRAKVQSLCVAQASPRDAAAPASAPRHRPRVRAALRLPLPTLTSVSLCAACSRLPPHWPPLPSATPSQPACH